MRFEDDLLWEAVHQNGWALRWLRHVVAAAALAGFGGLLWLGGETFVFVALFCGASLYAVWGTAYWLRDRRRLVRVTVVDDGLRRIRVHHVNGRTTDHDARMVNAVHITHREHDYDPDHPSMLGPGAGIATLRLRIAGRKFTSRWAGLNSEELHRVEQSWRTVCPDAAMDGKRIPGRFAGYSN
ncbi:hypothetical protein [Actinomadura sp. WMMA1423]|uniref:hypothetical protein n=1 Tax=Actinomadura sp. WMMA1423 TaxID=2591108 RepID=UPI001146C75E|nr:hypothetical protein [Actinomadura sp. WMMA1423]